MAPYFRSAGIVLLLCACSNPAPAPSALPALVACSVSEGQASPTGLAAAKALQSVVQGGPLYLAAASRSALEACVWRFPEGGALVQEYRFRNGSRLRVEHDAGIEYSHQSLSLAEPATEPAEALLKQAEIASFGPQGCGIDWKATPEQSAPTTAAEAGTVSESVHRGNACNCQARVRRNAAGQVLGLALRSAC